MPLRPATGKRARAGGRHSGRGDWQLEEADHGKSLAAGTVTVRRCCRRSSSVSTTISKSGYDYIRLFLFPQIKRDYLRLFTIISDCFIAKTQTIIRDYCIISQKTIISLIALRLFHLFFSPYIIAIIVIISRLFALLLYSLNILI
jgi:hypothetical protein